MQQVYQGMELLWVSRSAQPRRRPPRTWRDASESGGGASRTGTAADADGTLCGTKPAKLPHEADDDESLPSLSSVSRSRLRRSRLAPCLRL